MLKPEFEEAAKARQREASCLAANGHLTGAVYLAGYVIECRLKHYLERRNRNSKAWPAGPRPARVHRRLRYAGPRRHRKGQP